MKNDETGEFELVLGNRQLLGGFFVVVVLFAVFFVMGYIVGHNTSGPPRLTASDQAIPAATAASQPPADTRPLPAAAPPTQQAAPTPQPYTPPSAEPEPKSEPAAPVSPTPVEPAPGETYLQVVSVAQHEAELVARTLHDKGFPSSLSPGPTGRIRVLVGPYTDLGVLGKAKADLENLGFHPIVKK